MKKWILVIFIIFNILMVSGCDNRPNNKRNLSYTEYIKIGQQYASSGETEKAIDVYKKALLIRPDDAETHFILGELYKEAWTKTYTVAFRNYQIDVFSNPEKKQDKNLLFELEKFGLKNEYKNLAAAEFRETIKYDPNNWKARFLIGNDLFSNKHYKEAIDEYKKVIEINPNDSHTYIAMADIYEKTGDYDLAIQNFTKAFQLNSDAEYYYYSLGRLYIREGNEEKMVEMFKKLRDMKSIYYDRLMSFKYYPKTRD